MREIENQAVRLRRNDRQAHAAENLPNKLGDKKVMGKHVKHILDNDTDKAV